MPSPPKTTNNYQNTKYYTSFYSKMFSVFYTVNGSFRQKSPHRKKDFIKTTLISYQ